MVDAIADRRVVETDAAHIKRPASEAPRPVNEAAAALTNTLAEKRKQAVDPDTVLAELAGKQKEVALDSDTHIKVDDVSTPEAVQKARDRMAQLRDPARVGKDAYGKGLVNTYHKGAETVADHEAAQQEAYNALADRVDRGLVDPAALGTDMVLELNVENKLDLEDAPEHYEGIPQVVGKELASFVEQGFITEAESQVISQEIETFSRVYHEAYPEASVATAYELVRDNARKLTYQTKRDKQVFSGSDHGIKHILQGNMRFADQVMVSMAEQGMQLTAKDNILIRQTIIDHDCGYDCGCAQAPKGFEASKDHPIFSTGFIEANEGYYTDKFGQDGFTAIRDSVRDHSYPTALPSHIEPGQDIHKDVVRSISSTVDSLGVTAETKTPLFFTKPEAVRVLLKVRLAMETMGEGGGKSIPPELMTKYKAELAEVASSEQNSDRREGYTRSIEDFFNEFTAETTLGHYTGVVDSVKVARTDDGRVVPDISLRMSRIHALLGGMFGGKVETQAFSKAMADFGMTKGELQRFGAVVEGARTTGTPPAADSLVFDSGQARFVVNPQLAENASDEFSDIRSVVEEAHMVSVRTEINGLLDEVKRGGEGIDAVQAKFIASISSKTTAGELGQLAELMTALSDTSESGDKDPEGNPITVSQSAALSLRHFLTAQEKEFLGI